MDEAKLLACLLLCPNKRVIIYLLLSKQFGFIYLILSVVLGKIYDICDRFVTQTDFFVPYVRTEIRFCIESKVYTKSIHSHCNVVMFELSLFHCGAMLTGSLQIHKEILKKTHHNLADISQFTLCFSQCICNIYTVFYFLGTLIPLLVHQSCSSIILMVEETHSKPTGETQTCLALKLTLFVRHRASILAGFAKRKIGHDPAQGKH